MSDADAAARVPRLQLRSGRAEPNKIDLTGPVTLGRAEDSDVVLFDETTSRHHTRVEPDEGDTWAAVDLGSANGTWMNGRRIERARLRHGDEIVMGSIHLRFLGGRADSTVIPDMPVQVESSIAVAQFDVAASVDTERGTERLRLLHDVSTLFGRERQEDVLTALLARLGESLPIRRAAALRIEAGTIIDGAYWHRGRRAVAFEVSQTVLQRVIETGEGLLVRSVSDNPVLGRRESLIRDRTQSAIVVPLLVEGEALGVLYADTDEDEALSRDDLELLLAISAPAALALRNAELVERLAGENRRLRRELRSARPLIGESVRFRATLDLARRCAPQDTTVLLTGETGTGKELVARFLHDQSPRAAGPFVAVNCAALPAALVESELFGHVAGAFTGAHRDQPGQFRSAQGGTLFLDELGELPLEAQAKMLRVLEEREVRPVGGERSIPVDIRVVAATNRDLQQAVEAGGFREDLFYRIGVVRIAVPPLRDRTGDVRLLAESFLAGLSRAEAPRTLGAAALARLESYPWPGNVRELRNVIERAALLSSHPTLEPADLFLDVDAKTAAAEVLTLKEAERRAIELAWQATGGKKGETAERLGTSWPTLNKKMREYGIE